MICASKSREPTFSSKKDEGERGEHEVNKEYVAEEKRNWENVMRRI